jgi:hypothetical protein
VEPLNSEVSPEVPARVQDACIAICLETFQRTHLRRRDFGTYIHGATSSGIEQRKQLQVKQAATAKQATNYNQLRGYGF